MSRFDVNPGGRRVAPTPLVVALDLASADAAWVLARSLAPTDCALKVGLELFTRAGPDLVRALHAEGFAVFLDLKFHDIPNTVAAACRAAAELGVWLINVHALGGPEMMAAARAAVDEVASGTRVIAVTLLTSSDDRTLGRLGLGGTAAQWVDRLSALAHEEGLDGVVCSAHEATAMRQRFGAAGLVVTPGIRPAGAGNDDQSRVATPAEALAAGASHLVLGRPITRAPDPATAVRDVLGALGRTA